MLRLSLFTVPPWTPRVRFLQTDPYRTLGISRTAKKSQIKSAFIEKSKQCHPDKFPDNKSKEQQFKEVNEAWVESYNPTNFGYALRVKNYKMEKFLCAKRGREKKREKKGRGKERKKNDVIVKGAEKMAPLPAQNEAEGTEGRRPEVVEAKFCAFTMRYALKKTPTMRSHIGEKW